FRDKRTPQLGFVGQTGGYHMRRARLIALLLASGVPLVAGTGSREVAADVYAESVASFNASLNGDLNFRVFEALSAGGCLLTDRLAPEAGLELLLEEDTHYLAYDAPEELLDKARYPLRHPDHALTIPPAANTPLLPPLL